MYLFVVHKGVLSKERNFFLLEYSLPNRGIALVGISAAAIALINRYGTSIQLLLYPRQRLGCQSILIYPRKVFLLGRQAGLNMTFAAKISPL